MLTDPQKVFDKAEEMAARYKQMLLSRPRTTSPWASPSTEPASRPPGSLAAAERAALPFSPWPS